MARYSASKVRCCLPRPVLASEQKAFRMVRWRIDASQYHQRRCTRPARLRKGSNLSLYQARARTRHLSITNNAGRRR